MTKRKKLIGNLLMQFNIFLFALQCLMFKLASNYWASEGLGDYHFYVYMALGLVLTAVYAVIWQQSLKMITLNSAYAQKNFYMVWSIVFSVFILNEEIYLNNILGAGIIIVGIWMVTRDE